MDQADRLRSKIEMAKSSQASFDQARVITITSGKGGVGKTSLSVNLALQFQKMGKRTIIIDADFGLANIEVMLGVHPKYNISDLSSRNMDIEDIITPGPEGIGFISGGSGVGDLVGLDRSQLQIFLAKLAKLDKLADIIIVDTGAGISEIVQEFVISSPEVIMLLTPEPTSTMDAYSLLKTLNRRKEFSTETTSIKVVSNRVDNDKIGLTLFQNLNLVSSRFLKIKLDYLGAIPQDKAVLKAVLEQKPVSISYPNSHSAKALQAIATELDGKESKKENEKEGFTGVFLNLLRSHRNK